ncbi:MAG: ATP-binding protein, partial [Halobacteriaceae archaeon]
PRQAGKTTLLQRIQNQLETAGEQTLFLNFDIDTHRRYCQSQEELVKKLRLEFGDAEGFVFLDEIQRKQNAGVFLKGLYDRGLPYNLIVSGSGSIELTADVKESLVGRKRVFQLPTVTDYQYTDRLDEYFEVEVERTRSLLDDYMNYGGYPRIVTTNAIEEKRREMDELYNSYLNRDVATLLNVQKIDAYARLVTLLADQVGGLLKYAKVASDLSVQTATVRDYLAYL